MALTSTLARGVRVLVTRRSRVGWAIAAIAAAVVALGAIRAVADHVDGWATRWRGGAAMVVYLGEGIEPARAHALTDELAALPGVVRAELIGPAEATQRLRAALGPTEALLDGVDPEALPGSIELVLEPGARDVVAASPLLAALRASDSVDEVAVDGEAADQLGEILTGARALLSALVALLSVCALITVVGVTRLALADDATSASERQVARLLGAGPAYRLAPSVVAGAVLGAVAVAIGAALAAIVCGGHGAALLAPLTRALGDGAGVGIAADALAAIGLGAGLGMVGGALAGAAREPG
ncbi:MAG: permease-like cell division protein FtsX [Kofleriaceae bacterium]